MKKVLLLASVLIGWASVTFAQDFGVWEYSHDTHASMNKVERYIYRKVVGMFASKEAVFPWVKTVQQQIYRATPHQGLVGGIVKDFIPHQSVPLTQQQSRAITPIVNQWNKALNQNQSLYFFRVQVLRPRDVLSLQDAEVKQLASLLTGKINLPVEHHAYKHYLVRVTLPGNSPIHLLFNCYMKEIYIVRDVNALPNIPLEELPLNHLKQ